MQRGCCGPTSSGPGGCLSPASRMLMEPCRPPPRRRLSTTSPRLARSTRTFSTCGEERKERVSRQRGLGGDAAMQIGVTGDVGRVRGCGYSSSGSCGSSSGSSGPGSK